MKRTGDVEIEDIIFLDDIVYELLAVLVDYEYLPLLDVLAGGMREVRGARTSPRVVARIVFRITAHEVSMVLQRIYRHGAHALSLDVYHGGTRVGHGWRGRAANAACRDKLRESMSRE